MTSNNSALSSSWLKTGKIEIDDSAILGYKPAREIRDLTLVIGDGAKIRSGTVVYAGSRIGKNLETGHNVIIREENVIGDDLKIWSNSIIDYGCKVGSQVKIHCDCYVAQLTILEDDVFLAPGVMIANEKYPTGKFSSDRIEGAIIKKGAKMGINSTILPGVTIGINSIVGAGSVVTKDVPPNTVVYGNPARVVKSILSTKMGAM
jgi:acetyltransferase-like isoleucine patch superfamily enzyme